MIEKFKNLENLGTPKYLSELCDKLVANKKRTQKNVQEYFQNRTIEWRYIFDWWLPFLKVLWIIIENSGMLDLDNSFLKPVNSQKQFNEKILERMIEKLKDDEIFKGIFSSDNISYDIVHKYIQIKNSAFGFVYSNFKQLLINFWFLALHPDWFPDKLIINPEYKNIFDKKILPDIHKRRMWLDELKKKLAQQQINWEQAELFVLEYERKRLSKDKNVEWVSPYYVSAGYDILSYHTSDSEVQDRFIEVKSYSWNMSFYLTRNEVDNARIRQDDYYLYLINRDEIKNPSYEPMIIKNPYENVLKENENRKKEVDTYYVVNIT